MTAGGSLLDALVEQRPFALLQLDEDARTSFEVWTLELDRAETRKRWRRHGYPGGWR